MAVVECLAWKEMIKGMHKFCLLNLKGLHACMLISLFVVSDSEAHQARLSMGIPRQEY